jgi:D-3-phosphoglycerate dehydrogenase
MGRELWGKKLGLVGFGRIGRELATRAHAFEMQVSAADPLLPAWPAGFDWVRRSTLDEMLRGVDFLSLHLPLTPETRDLIGASELAAMSPESVIVNCARGGVVNEDALLQALEAGRPRGAILDVFTTEPPMAEHPLLRHPRVVATPHLGASTAEAQQRAGDEAATIVIESLAALQG